MASFSDLVPLAGPPAERVVGAVVQPAYCIPAESFLIHLEAGAA
jgi:hypothetical protein